jgi:hypothetical protein
MSDRWIPSGRVYAAVAMWFVLWTGPAHADVRNLYTIEGVTVDERAADEVAAKARGIEIAQQAALQLLIEKVTLRDDYDRLPDIDSNAVQRAIRDYAIVEEKFGGGRYVAKLTVRFKRSVVREMLRQRDVPIAETVSRPVVVLPVYRAAGSVLLWDDPNPWFAAWANHPSPSGLLPMVVPLGDYSDIAAISAEQALNGDEKRLSAVAGKYDAFGTLVAVAELDIDPHTGVPSVQVSMTRFGKADTGRTFVRSFSASTGEGVDGLLNSAVEALIIRAEEDWKRDNLQSVVGRQRISIFVPLKSLQDWLAIRNRLAQVSPIIDMKLAQLSIEAASVDLEYSGGPDQLRLSMAQSNLDLEFESARGGYVLRLGAQ